jgi:uncharacterized damage-inducible protein DinB
MHPVPALFRRNAWATRELLELCARHPEIEPASADADVYGGIRAQFNHIVGAESGYLGWVTGEMPADRADARSPRPLSALRDPAAWLAERWEGVLAQDRDVQEVRPHRRGAGVQVMAGWVPLVQAVHHGDDHRTQVATLLARHGAEGLDLDVWAFAERHADGAGAPREWWPALLRRFLGHHVWATETLLRFCATLPAEATALEAPGTFGAVGATLDHLVSADRSYLSRLLEGRPVRTDVDSGDPAVLLEHFERQRRRWMEYLDSRPDFEAQAGLRRQGGTVAAWTVVAQAVHHGNDHRTHVGTVLLHHGIDAPNVDVWQYATAEKALLPRP